MKKNLFISLLTILTISTSLAYSAPQKTTGTTVARTCVDFVLDNKVKCAVIAVLAYDAYLHGIDSSIANKSVEYVKNSGLQLYGNTLQACATSANAASTTTAVAHSAVHTTKTAVNSASTYIQSIFA